MLLSAKLMVIKTFKNLEKLDQKNKLKKMKNKLKNSKVGQFFAGFGKRAN